MTDSASAAPTAARIVDGISGAGGKHCETTTLGVLFEHAGLRLSESMLFGLGSGLSFVYWDSRSQSLPFLGGRVKPFVLTQTVASRLGADLRVEETTSARRAWDRVRRVIDDGSPIGLQLDSHDLDYFGSRVHFAGHVVAMYGYDAETAYLVDTDQQGGRVTTSLESLARARAARGPMSARHRSFTLTLPPATGRPDRVAQAVVPAIVECAEGFLAPPIANVGGRGIRTAADRIVSWLQRVEEPSRDLATIAMLMERGGTGGALFRNLYRDFLTESAELGAHGRVIREGAAGFAESAALWTQASDAIAHAGATGSAQPLQEAAGLLRRIEGIETAAMTALASLGESAFVGRGA